MQAATRREKRMEGVTKLWDGLTKRMEGVTKLWDGLTKRLEGLTKHRRP